MTIVAATADQPSEPDQAPGRPPRGVADPGRSHSETSGRPEPRVDPRMQLRRVGPLGDAIEVGPHEPIDRFILPAFRVGHVTWSSMNGRRRVASVRRARWSMTRALE